MLQILIAAIHLTYCPRKTLALFMWMTSLPYPPLLISIVHTSHGRFVVAKVACILLETSYLAELEVICSPTLTHALEYLPPDAHIQELQEPEPLELPPAAHHASRRVDNVELDSEERALVDEKLNGGCGCVVS